MKTALITVGIVVVIALGALVYVMSTFRLGPATPPQPNVVGSPQLDIALTDESRQRLNAEGVALLPTLEEARASGDITPMSVRDALISFGYLDQFVDTTRRSTNAVEFSVEFEDGCLSGTVTPTEVDAKAADLYLEGCGRQGTP